MGNEPILVGSKSSDKALRRLRKSGVDERMPPAAAATVGGEDVTIYVHPARHHPHRGRVAQLAEQLTLNQ